MPVLFVQKRDRNCPESVPVLPFFAVEDVWPVETGPVVDWALQYGKQPCVWACTAKAWYRLMTPAPAYAMAAAAVQRRLDMCSRATTALEADGERLTFEAGEAAARQAHLSATAGGAPGGPSWDCCSAEEFRADAGFIYQQLVAWVKVSYARNDEILHMLYCIKLGQCF